MIKDKKVILTIPGVEIADAVMRCGMSSGRDTDKTAMYEIKMQYLPGSDIKVPLHSRVAIKCSLKEFVETGDYYLHICNADEVFRNESEDAVFAWNGYSQICPAQLKQ